MEDEIINKVANSALEVFDLEDYYPEVAPVELDIAPWLFEGFLLKEKDFREQLKNHDWTQYENKLVALNCSTDAILPAWTFMLVSSYLQPYASLVVQGTIDQLFLAYFQEVIEKTDFSIYNNKPTIIKGCSKKAIPEEAYVMATQKMMLHARSIMFGEACSAVPIFKKKKLQ